MWHVNKVDFPFKILVRIPGCGRGRASNYHSKLLLISALINTNLILSLSSLHEMYINCQSIRLLAGKNVV